MSKDGLINFWTYANFLGIGYFRDNQNWHISPLFSSAKEAKDVWDNEIKPMDEKSINMSFIERKTEYKFFVYSSPLQLLPKNNFSLFRSLDISQNYQMFKREFNGKVLFEFAVLAEPEPVIISGQKVISNVNFIKANEVKPNSPEWLALEAQKRAREDARKSDAYKV